MNPIANPPVAVLSAEELRIIMAYRKMDVRRRRENLALLESDAVDYPTRAAPTLRLIARGAK